ncbi:MAG: HPr family phosphocarrier protein [bacterium]|nr:HPr family phosphocarrier protein [bacterium]
MAKKISRSPATSSKGESKLKITNELGLHARAAALFVKTASGFKSEVVLEKGDKRVNGKSIMGLLMLAASRGSTLKIKTDGDDASEALQALESLVRNKFGER